MNDQEAAALRQQRQEKFKKLGIPVGAGHMNENSVVQTGGGNPDVRNTLNMIKRGALAGNFKKFINIEAEGNSDAGYQIPVAKNKNSGRVNPNAPQIKPENKVEVQSFVPQQGNSEAEMIERMFGGGGGGMPSMGNSIGGPMAQRSLDTELNLDSMQAGMPTFNPMAHLQKKAAQRQNISRNPVTEEFYTEAPQTSQPQMNYTYLKEMMKDVAKDISEKMIREILKEYSESYSNKKTYEVYNKDQNVIKTSDGKYYKLTPVTLKKKVG